MEVNATPDAVVARFVAALGAGDAAGAAACSSVDGWSGPGDGPGRLYRQAHDDAGWSLDVAGAPASGRGTRAAVPVALVAGAERRRVRTLTLLGEGSPWRIEAVATGPDHAAAFLAGAAPARIFLETLPEDDDAARAARTLVQTLAAASEGDEAAGAWLNARLEGPEDERLVVGRLIFEYGAGVRLEVREARGLLELGRAVVRVEASGGTGDVDPFLYHDRIRGWYARSPFFAPSVLLRDA